MTSKESRPGCLGILLNLGRSRSQKPPPEKNPVSFPYAKRDAFLSAGEFRFYEVLRLLVPEGYTLIAKVRLGDLFFVSRPHENRGAQNKIDRKHVDFVICDSSTMQPSLAIELDDSSHERKDRTERDVFVDQVFEAAELPLLHVRVVQTYDATGLEEQIRKRLLLQ